MIVVASSNGRVGIGTAMDILRAGGSAIDAVEAGIRLVEDNAADHTVGYGGFPNILGEVELDASIMDGRTLSSGAVGAMRGVRPAISVARKIMERLPHVFLVAEGAERFASEMGFERQSLLTEEAKQVWRERLEKDLPASIVDTLPTQTHLSEWVKLATDPERAGGTVNFIAQDTQGHICTGVSTSGWAWKYPGRLGDSPVIGAGNYADDRFGAAACTGMGEMALRACTAFSIIAALKHGKTLHQAGRDAMMDLRDLGGLYSGQMNIICLNHEGRHEAFSSNSNKTYLVQRPEQSEPEELPRVHIAIPERWGEE